MAEIGVLILSPIPALRAGLSALLAENTDFRVYAEEPEWITHHAAPEEVQVIVATPGGVNVSTLQTLTGVGWLLVAGDAQEWVEEAAVLFDPAQHRERYPGPGWGILSMDIHGETLQTAVRSVAEGLVIFSPATVEVLAHEALASEKMEVENAAWSNPLSLPGRLETDAEREEEVIEPLTRRESEVLAWLGQGLTNKQIAVKLHISEHTVKYHLSALYAKMGVTSRAEAVRVGARNGLTAL